MKYKILFVAARPTGGVQYHRLHMPHNALARLHPEFEVATVDTVVDVPDDFLKQFQLVVFSRTLSYEWGTRAILNPNAIKPWELWQFRAQTEMERLKKLGLVVVCDMDDTWKLHRKHLYYWNYVKEHIGEHNEYCARHADQLICTTPFLADELRSYNDNVEVIANCIDPTVKQYQAEPKPSEMIRFGWLGSSSHTDDMEMMATSMRRIWEDRDVAPIIQLVLGGFSMEDEVQLLDPKTGKSKPIKMHKSQQVCARYERIFTDEYKGIREYPKYVDYLKNYTQSWPEYMEPMPYKRIWFRDINTYATAYDEIDVALAPIVDHFFNNCKSQLKMIEAGFMKKALICSDAYPYTIDGVNNKNCLMVPQTNLYGWYAAIKRLALEPELRADLAAALQQDMTTKYSIEPWTKLRADLYKQLIDKKNAG